MGKGVGISFNATFGESLLHDLQCRGIVDFQPQVVQLSTRA